MTDRSVAQKRSWWLSPIPQIVLSRVREFYREPEALFWVYGFPILMVVTLGIAFRNQPVEQIAVDVVRSLASDSIVASLKTDPRMVVQHQNEADCRKRLRAGKTDLIVMVSSADEEADARPVYVYQFDPQRPPSILARNAVDDVLQRAAGRTDAAAVRNEAFNEPGGRYVDFLVPGLLGMSLMGGGLWGVGFVTVDLRIRKLLKRFLATPMRKSHFLGGLMISRLLFLIPEVFVLILFARVAFGVTIQGSVLAVCFLILLGAATFSGIGLLVASRAKTIEAVSGLMNLVMLPMWVLSGIFFSSDRFPTAFQPLIHALPLTALINALRSVILEGSPLLTCWPQVLLLSVWCSVSFVLALRWFRWTT